MPFRCRSSFAVAVVFVLTGAAGCKSEDAGVASPTDLVGGTVATEADYPSTLLMLGNCTVARVGPVHILTAAHCVTDLNTGQMRLDFAEGARVRVTENREVVTSTDGRSRELRIKKVHVPEAYRDERGVAVLTAEKPPDVAVIELDAADKEALDGIPIASVDLSPVAAGDAVVIMGYGCEAGVKGAINFKGQRLKFHRTTVVGVESQVHAGGAVENATDADAARLAKQYIFTPGQGSAPDEASLCPGDSGGPVYRDDGTQRRIVGVNAYYSFHPPELDSARISVTNWHTRLDTASRFDVGSWLAVRGVSVIGEPNGDHSRDCEISKKTSHSTCGAFAKFVNTHGGETAIGAPTNMASLVQNKAGQWEWTQTFEHSTLRLRDGVVHDDPRPADSACTGKPHGTYCGRGLGDADSRSLYTCFGGRVVGRTRCNVGCSSQGKSDACTEPPSADPCAKAYAGDGRYCAYRLGGSYTELLQCHHGVTFSKAVCPRGCAPSNVGPDTCSR